MVYNYFSNIWTFGIEMIENFMISKALGLQLFILQYVDQITTHKIQTLMLLYIIIFYKLYSKHHIHLM
jgi:hypothetical protein